MRLTKEQLDACFAGKTHQSECLVDIYKLSFPDWEAIEHMEGFPTCGERIWKDICNRFIEFDGKHHAENRAIGKAGVMPGGLWLNNGFSCDKALADYEVKRCEVRLKSGMAIAA